VTEEKFEHIAEQFRRDVENMIADRAGVWAGQGVSVPAALWALASGAVTASSHTVALIMKEHPGADAKAMRRALKLQIDDAYRQAVRMHAN
jgi:hypothetical protein